MKRVVSSSLVTLLIIAVVAISFFFLQNIRHTGTDPRSAIPADATFFVMADLSEFPPESMIGPTYRKAFGITPAFIGLEHNIRWFDSLITSNDAFQEFTDGSSLVIAAQVTGAQSFDFLFIKSLDKKFDDETLDRLMTTLLLPDQHLSMRKYDGVTIREVMDKDKPVLAYSIVKGLFLASKTAFLVEDGIRQARTESASLEVFTQLETENSNNVFSVYLNFKKLGSLLGTIADASSDQSFSTPEKFGNWASADVDWEEDAIRLKGSMLVTDSMTLTACLEGQIPGESQINGILPARTAFFRNVSLSDKNRFLQKFRSLYFNTEQQKRLQDLETEISDTYGIRITTMMDQLTGDEFGLFITEPSGSSYDNNTFAVFSLRDPGSALKSLQKIRKSVNLPGTAEPQEYKGSSIGQIKINHLIPSLYGDEFRRITGTWYAVVGNHIIFANQQASLRLLIDDISSGYLLIKASSYKSITENLPSKSNLIWYVKPSSAMGIFRSAANEIWKSHADKFQDAFTSITGFAFSLNAGNRIHHFNSIASFTGGDIISGLKQILTIDTDTAVSSAPLITVDPRTGSRQMLFQDESNSIYLCDNTGNILWKETINGKIEGAVYEIDLFKNNLRQFLFNTREHLYLLDENGKPVGNYPIRLPAPATNSLSVFDFDGRKDPRIYIACENRQVYAYLPSGKPMPGWSLAPLQGVVKRSVEHKRILNKDYLLICDETGGLQIVTKLGEPGIVLSEKFVVARNALTGMKDDGSLVMTDNSGNIKIINTTGKIETIPLNAAGEDHGFVFMDADEDGNKDFIFTDEDEVTAYNSSLTMIFRKTFESKLASDVFLQQNEDGSQLLCVRSPESDQTWLITANGEYLNGSPVPGSSKPAFGKTGNDGKLHLLIGGRGNYFRVYGLE